MQKPQAVLSPSKFSQELITFAGYAGILLGWLLVSGFLIWWLVEFFTRTATPDVLVVGLVPSEPTAQISAMAVFLSLIIIAVMFAALWVYVARWTKSALILLARIVRVKSTQYWAFCTIILLIGWVAAAGLLYAASNDKYASEFLFVSAAAITAGALSFGVADLKGVVGLPTTTEFSVKFSTTRSLVKAGTDKPRKASKRSVKKDAVLRKKANPNT